MKRMAALLILLMLMISTAVADENYEWSRTCRSKTSRTTPVYAVDDGETVLEALPANTYVTVSSERDGLALVEYMTHDGRRTIGLVAAADVTSAVVYVTAHDGTKHGYQELIYAEMLENGLADADAPVSCSAADDGSAGASAPAHRACRGRISCCLVRG